MICCRLEFPYVSTQGERWEQQVGKRASKIAPQKEIIIVGNELYNVCIEDTIHLVY